MKKRHLIDKNRNFYAIKRKLLFFIVCSDGTFGKNCTEQCGECLGKEKCDHVNGTCVNGCNPGYQGITCTEGGQS